MLINFAMPKFSSIAMAAILLVLFSSMDALAKPNHGNRPQQGEIDKIVSKVTPAVVAISFGDIFDSNGVIISKDGLALSHCHHTTSLLVARRNSVLFRKLPVILHDGTKVEAKLLATHGDSSGLIEYSLPKLSGDRKWPYEDVL